MWWALSICALIGFPSQRLLWGTYSYSFIKPRPVFSSHYLHLFIALFAASLSCAASHPSICPPPPPPSKQNNDNETPLHCAAQYGHFQVVRLLLEELTDPTMRNNKFETPLDLAALYGRLEVVKLLLCAHPNLLSCNTKKHTPLHLASRNGHLSVVQVLLDAGMDINYEVGFKTTQCMIRFRLYLSSP